MSESRPRSRNHRNPANAPSAAQVPTRTQTSEESGMQMDQRDTQTTTALLRKEISVDTPVRGRPLERSHGSRRDGTGCWSSESGMGRVANVVAHRLDRLEPIGNGQVPVVTASAFKSLSDRR
jgi:hypothetical protein